MPEESAYGFADFGAKYEFCPDPEWWKSGISYEEASEGLETRLSDLEIWFNERADRWERETAIHSSPGARYLHRDYITIMGYGIMDPISVVPLIMGRLGSKPGDWFFALERIAGKNIASDCEDFESARDAWSNWAKEKGFLNE
jgi:hypothetical protein